MFDTVNVCSRDLLVSRVTHSFPVSFKRDQPVISKGPAGMEKGPVPSPAAAKAHFHRDSRAMLAIQNCASTLEQPSHL
jgi:hypothetical protein